jgi:hypothetical protein
MILHHYLILLRKGGRDLNNFQVAGSTLEFSQCLHG